MTYCHALVPAYHSLAPAELDEIASGEPDDAVVRTLLSGQYSKRVIMIKAILAAAAERFPDAHARLEEAYDLLAAAQQADPDVVRAILTHPSADRWTTRCLRRLEAQPGEAMPLTADPSQLAAFAAAAAIRAGHAFTIEVPVRDNTVKLPTLGLADLSSAAPRTGTWPVADNAVSAIVSHDGRQVTITAGQSAVTLPADPSQDSPGWQGLRSLRSQHLGASISVEFDDLGPGQDADGARLAGRQGHDAVATWQSSLDGAWATLTQHHPRRARALAAGLISIMPLARPNENITISATNEAGVGGLMMTLPDNPISFAEILVHEFQHSVLAAVIDIASLHAAGPEAVYYAPWREDPRPLEGLLQGLYAFLGVTGYWEVQRKVLTGREQTLADFQLARRRYQVSAGARTLLDSGALTRAGTTIVHGIAVTAERWCGLSVSEEPQWLAERAVADHWIRWQLRHRQFDQSSVDLIALAWHRGLPFPGRLDEITATVHASQGQPPKSGRSRLLRWRLADPDWLRELRADPTRAGKDGVSVSEADLAYAADDFERAVQEYRAAIQAGPEDIEPWAGLALANAELRPPAVRSMIPRGLARSVYLRIRKSIRTEPDLDELEEWMADPEGR